MTHGATPMLAKVLAALAVAALLVAGVLFFGRLADDSSLAMALTAAWFGVVLAAGFLITRSRRDLLVPMGAAFAIVAGAVGVLIGLPTLRDKEVNERVVTAAPASGAPASAPEGGAEPGGSGASEQPARNELAAEGSFRSIAHAGRGKASVVELAEGGRKLTLTSFETDSGPDLRLYVSTKDPAEGGGLGEFRDLGALKGNKGDQQYTLGRDIDIGRYSNVVVWCRAFSVGFTSAALEPA